MSELYVNVKKTNAKKATGFEKEQILCSTKGDVLNAYRIIRKHDNFAIHLSKSVFLAYLQVVDYSDVDKRPIVFMDLAVNEKPVGTIFIQLFNETVPITSENFRLLATGKIQLI